MSSPSVSIIIASTRPNMLVEVLKCLQNQSFQDFEIIIICIQKNKKIIEIASNFGAKLYEDQGKGRCYARNLGLKNSIGEIVVFFDDDISINENWIETAFKFFHLNSDIGGIGGLPITPKDYRSIVYPLRFFLNVILGISNWDLDFNNRKEVNYLSGSNMAFRRDVLFLVGGFDENFYGPCAGEDADICLRITRKGYKLILDSKLNIYHYSNFIKRIITHHRQNELYFLALTDNKTYWHVKNRLLNGVLKWIIYILNLILQAVFWTLYTYNLKVFFYFLKGIVIGYKRAKNCFFSAPEDQ